LNIGIQLKGYNYDDLNPQDFVSQETQNSYSGIKKQEKGM
jgi:hypothetical protein